MEKKKAQSGFLPEEEEIWKSVGKIGRKVTDRFGTEMRFDSRICGGA